MANAGIAPVGRSAAIDPADFERTIEVNLLGVWRASAPRFRSRCAQGYILPTASLAAAGTRPCSGHYAATKAGVEAIIELAPPGDLAHRHARRRRLLQLHRHRWSVRASTHPPAQLHSDGHAGRRSARPAPRPTAGEAIMRGIERRSHRLCAALGAAGAMGAACCSRWTSAATTTSRRGGAARGGGAAHAPGRADCKESAGTAAPP